MPPSHVCRWVRGVMGSVGARLEVPAEGLQAQEGGSRTETLQSIRGPSPQGHREGGRLPSGPGRCSRSGRRMWSLRGGGLPPSFAPGPEGCPRARLWLPGRAGLPTAAGASIPWRPHPPTTTGRPKSYFRRLVETRPVWPDRGTGPPTGAPLPGLPGPARHSDSHLCGAVGCLSAGQPPRALLPQPLQRESPVPGPTESRPGAGPGGASSSPTAPPDTPPKHRHTSSWKVPGGLGSMSWLSHPTSLSGFPSPGSCPGHHGVFPLRRGRTPLHRCPQAPFQGPHPRHLLWARVSKPPYDW